MNGLICLSILLPDSLNWLHLRLRKTKDLLHWRVSANSTAPESPTLFHPSCKWVKVLFDFSACAMAVAPKHLMLLPIKSKYTRVRLDRRHCANCATPSSLIWFPLSCKCVKVRFDFSPFAIAAAPKESMLLQLKSKRTRVILDWRASARLITHEDVIEVLHKSKWVTLVTRDWRALLKAAAAKLPNWVFIVPLRETASEPFKYKRLRVQFDRKASPRAAPDESPKGFPWTSK